MKKVYITGAAGMLGSDMLKVWASDYEVLGVDLADYDLTDRDEVRKRISDYQPDLIIHCAAYTNVDGAESNKDTAYKVNVNATENVALAAREVGAEMVYISTDFVFDGSSSEPYLESDLTNPISVYGDSKCQGEERVRAILDAHYIARISWLYGRNGHNFVYTIRNAAMQHPELKVVDDQWGTPTWTIDVASTLKKIVAAKKWGTFHLSSEGEASWFDFAETLLQYYGINTPVKTQSSEALNRPAPRPAYSVIKNQNLWEKCGAKMPHWKVSLKKFIEDYSL